VNEILQKILFLLEKIEIIKPKQVGVLVYAEQGSMMKPCDHITREHITQILIDLSRKNFMGGRTIKAREKNSA